METGAVGFSGPATHRAAALVAAALAPFVVSACATTTFHHDRHRQPVEQNARVVLMPLDVELSEMTMAGLLEPNAEWTNAANAHLATALREHLERLGEEFVVFQPPADLEQERVFTQLLKLHETVGASILQFQVGPVRLPTLKERFDWSLGPEASTLASLSGADYALFVYVRDSYTSAGRAVMMFTVAAVAGVALPGGRQLGFASLVELRSGDLVWFNFLDSETGDLRDLESARDTVEELLEELPR